MRASVAVGRLFATLVRFRVMTLRSKLLWFVPVFLLLSLSEMLLTSAYLDSVRIKEIPFGFSEAAQRPASSSANAGDEAAIHAGSRLEQSRSFLHIFNVPYIVCFFAAKGKWPFVPPFMQPRVDATAKTLFSHNDSFIKQFCNKWVQIKECFRPLLGVTTAEPLRAQVEALAVVRGTPCTCANLAVSTESSVPVVYFDRDHIGNVSSDTIRNTIEFLESFLPPPTKKTKRKNHVRSRVDEIDIN